MNDDDELLTLGQAADRIGLSYYTIAIQARRGTLKARKIGYMYVVTVKDLHAYERDHKGKGGFASPDHPLHRKSGDRRPYKEDEPETCPRRQRDSEHRCGDVPPALHQRGQSLATQAYDTASDDDKLLNLKQAADRIGLTQGALVSQARQGVLRACKIGNMYVVTVGELRRYEREHKGKGGFDNPKHPYYKRRGGGGRRKKRDDTPRASEDSAATDCPCTGT